LQEVDNVYFLRSFTSAGVTRIFVNSRVQPIGRGPGPLVRRAQARRRHAPHAAARRARAVLQRRLRRHLRHHLRLHADGFSQRELRDYVEQVRSSCCRCGRVDRGPDRRQDEQIFLEFPTGGSRASAQPAAILAARAQNVVRPSGIVRTDREQFALRVSGAFASEQDCSTSLRGQRPLLRLRDIATVSAATWTRRSRCSASTASRRSGSRSP